MTFIAARSFKRITGKRRIRLIVIHTMEAPEAGTTAESVARYFANGAGGRPASAHYCVDADSTVQCVADQHVAYAAPGANHDGIQLELAGRAGQTAAQWADAYSQEVLKNAAKLAAAKARQYGIPIRHLTVAQLQTGQAGFIGHVDATRAFGRSTHTDPGPNFPWSQFLDMVRAELAPAQAQPVKNLPPSQWATLQLGSRGASVAYAQKVLKQDWKSGIMVDPPGQAAFGPNMQNYVRAFRRIVMKEDQPKDFIDGPMWVAMLTKRAPK